MKVLGISPLDKDATASLVEDGRVLFAAGEERFSRVKQHAGFPGRAIAAALEATGTSPADIDVVAYPFLTWEQEARLIEKAFADEVEFAKTFGHGNLQAQLAEAERRIPQRTGEIHGLQNPNERMQKSLAKRLFYRLAGATPSVSREVAARLSRDWAARAIEDHKKWNVELDAELAKLGLTDKLKRCEHHLSHAANAFHTSGYDRALIVTIDGYGSGLAGSVSLGEGKQIKRLRNLRFPYSLGSFYEMVTSSLGFHPDRHAGKVVGLAAYGDPAVLSDVLRSRFSEEDGDIRILENLNVHFSRHLSTRFPKIDLAAAWQYVLEEVAKKLVHHWVRETGAENLVLSGGVTANVKMNQRLHEVEGVKGLFVYPNMGDGGCGTGYALHLCREAGFEPKPFASAYLGPEFSDDEIRAVLDAKGLAYTQPEDFAADVARRIHSGQVVARFGGRMEYGPRALGNRSILYHAREPEVNHWLNKRLGRTEFMPFAPVTLWEARERCYKHLEGAEHTAEFMTVTFDCTDWMIESCPAAVHVDGTARPQLIRREVNPVYYDILTEYEKLSGIPCLINTSFNMHEEPIVCTPEDAVRAFLLGHLDVLAIGSFVVPNPESTDGQRNEPAAALAGANA